LATAMSRPSSCASTNASNAKSSLSSLESLLRTTNRIGMNCVDLPRPRDEARSTAWRLDSKQQELTCACTPTFVANRHFGDLSVSGSDEVATSPLGNLPSSLAALLL